jgi:RNA polymerase sigma factor (sigma-70 family)
MNHFATRNSEFAELMVRLESGSSDAAWELIDRYSSHVLRYVRRNMHYRLRSKFDSQDFVQMVWASFFRDPNQIKGLANPGQLIGLLASMARNKVISEVRRRLHSQNRSVMRETNLDTPDASVELFAKDPTPSSIAIARERWHQLVDHQPPHVKTIVERRLAGMTFQDIASELGLHERTVRRTIEKLLKKTRKG